MKPSLGELGEFIRREVDESGRSDATLEEARSRFQVEILENGPSMRVLPRRRTWVVAGALAAAIGLMALFGVEQFGFGPGEHEGPLTVALESKDTELVGAWVQSKAETKQLIFSDGTSLSLHPHTQVRVRTMTRNGATVDLGEGRTLARIEPLDDANWRFVAGPFVVRVTGTEFDLAWNSQEQVLELALHQGSVMLSGPTLDGERPVRKGEFVRVAVPKKLSPAHLASQTEGAGEHERVVSDPKGNDTTKPAARPDQADTSPSREDQDPSDRSTQRSSWSEVLRTGTPEQTVQAVERAGSGKVFSQATPEQLWSLASKARLGGRPTLARDALLALRNKHGTRGQTAYLLGKVHADQLGATSQAITWFEIYLKEAPGGALGEQAMGRLVELQAGTRAGTRAARHYLDRYPNGSYADFCRSQLR